MASDWLNIEIDKSRDMPQPAEPGTAVELAARLASPVNGRCPHGFTVGSGLCSVRGCGGSNSGGKKLRTCVACRLPYTGDSHQKGRRCPTCAQAVRRHRSSL